MTPSFLFSQHDRTIDRQKRVCAIFADFMMDLNVCDMYCSHLIVLTNSKERERNK